MIERLLRTNLCCLEAGGFGRRVGIKYRTFHFASSRPESCTDAFVRITFARHEIGAGAFGRALPGEARHRQVEASPEKMDRAALADEVAAKFFKNGIHGNQDAPEGVRERG